MNITGWLASFRKPQDTAITSLAGKIFQVSAASAEALKPQIRSRDEKDINRAWFTVICEFLYFFMHMSNRAAFAELGHERRCRLQDEMYPLLIRPTIEAIFGHWPAKYKEGMEREFPEKLADAETEYGRCRQMLDRENPLSRDALLSCFALNVCELLGADQAQADYATTFMKVTDLALGGLKTLDLSASIAAVGKEL